MSHSHTHAHAHGHAHDAPQVSAATLGAAVALTLAFVVAEAIGGWWGNSLALLSDAGHNLADAATLGLSWYALWMAGKPSHERMTFGYHRVGVFAALINAVSLVLIALFIGWEAIERLQHPQAASGALMIALATVAIVVNLAIGAELNCAPSTISTRSAWFADRRRRVAFGVVCRRRHRHTQWLLADPIVSLIIAALILYSSYGVLSESATVLLEGTPAGTDMPAVISAMKNVPGVLDVHDLHVSMVGPGVVACSCHILVAEQSVREGQQVLRAVVRDIEERFHITHTTVQVEVEGCDATDMYCGGQRSMSARLG
jgi:cobalt-zinc-cadmium efflux system protein